MKVTVFFYNALLSTGSFFDCYEYFNFFNRNGVDADFLVFANPTEEKHLMKYISRYVGELYIDKVKFVSNCKVQAGPRVHRLSSTLFTTSLEMLCSAYRYQELVSAKRYVVIHDRALSKYSVPIEKLKNLTVLYDQRFRDRLSKFENISYEKKLYFDIFAPVCEYDNAVLVNMVTHKRGHSLQLLSKYLADNDLLNEDIYILTKESDRAFFLEQRTSLKYIKFLEVPVFDIHSKYSVYLHLHSLDRDDESPRLLIESRFYGKNVIFPDWEVVKDGAYYRELDCRQGKSLTLTCADCILDIIK